MNPRLLVFDLDGTLLDPSHHLPPERRSLLLSLRNAGIETTLATGRPYASAASFAQQLELHLPLILLNGTGIFSVAGEPLWTRPMPQSTAVDILRLSSKLPLANHIYLSPTDPFFYTDRRGSACERIMERDHISCRVVKDLVRLLEDRMIDPVKMFIIGPRKTLESLRDTVAPLHPDSTCVFSEHDMLEFLAPGVSKGAALAVLCEQIGFRLEDVVAFGDNLNDLEMLRGAGFGVAMQSAPKAMQNAADAMTENLTDFVRTRFADRISMEA